MRVFYPVVEAKTNLAAIDIHATIWTRLLWISAANIGHGLVVDIDPALGQQVLYVCSQRAGIARSP